MKNGMFENKKEASDHIIAVVAESWMKSADGILSRGERPMPFSRCGQMMVRDEMDRDLYNRVRRWLDSEEIFRNARQFAIHQLEAGRYPAVAKHFTVSASAPMIQVPPMPALPKNHLVASAHYEVCKAIESTDGGRKCDSVLWARLQNCRIYLQESLNQSNS